MSLKPWQAEFVTGVRQAADHEAGHAVMAVLLGRPFKPVVMESIAGSGLCNFGKTSFSISSGAKTNRTTSRDFLESRLFLCLAGTAAECGIIGPSTALRGSDDIKSATETARALLHDAPPDEITEYLVYVSLRIKNIMSLAAIRAQTSIVARRLLVERELSSDRIGQLLSKSFSRQNGDIRSLLHGAWPIPQLAKLESRLAMRRR